ncbi:hypothetical protein EGR_05030 [Echinococcus granulosus]|uniref:Uncharacterized protein n=1 Tax=Echinococcus granulosus TaxID=6210 RepID=W6UPI3_ECHGR|nr:hypothetical protein EGR_05030 [Echinococcus granulosus]EUB60177.1 hypothetical protein EGR_05030 [Echinococcus granulosus]
MRPGGKDYYRAFHAKSHTKLPVRCVILRTLLTKIGQSEQEAELFTPPHSQLMAYDQLIYERLKLNLLFKVQKCRSNFQYEILLADGRNHIEKLFAAS